jgi:predicted Zn-dependent peptidase
VSDRAWYRGLAAAVTSLAVCACAVAQQIEDRVVEFQLENGMRFIVLARRQAPVFTGYIRFKVGGVDEEVGRTGLAHMFEHMAFKGTTTVGARDYRKEKALLAKIDVAAMAFDKARFSHPQADAGTLAPIEQRLRDLQREHRELVVKDELDDIYSRNGAVGLNASTGTDVTTYHVSLPTNRLELWMAMESDRLRDGVLREFYTERDVIAEERRMRSEVDPSGKLWENFVSTAFQAHGYQQPVIGWMSDIQQLTRADALVFREKYYVPSNAVVALVGDLDSGEVKELAERYFGRLPARPGPPEIRTDEPDQVGERYIKVKAEARPQVHIGYHKPTLPHHDDFVFDVIDGILSDGRTSRLYSALVKDQQVAVGVGTYQGVPGGRYNNLFVISAVPRHPHTVDEVVAAIDVELERLKTEPVGKRELQKIINQSEAGFIRRLGSNSGLASELSYFEIIAGDWRYMLDQIEAVRNVTPEDIQQAANKYFVTQNRTIAELAPLQPENGTGETDAQ